jgi:HPt (histidine-containing phosphotransfer) domain-containing protein
LLEQTNKVDKDRLNDYAIVVHGIKGSSRAIGAEELGLKAEELEYAAKSGRIGFCLAGNIPFQNMARKLISDLRDYLAAHGTPEEAKEERDAPEPELLLALKKACEDYQVSEIDDIMGELEKYSYREKNDLIKKLKAALDVSDFSDAGQLISQATGN